MAHWLGVVSRTHVERGVAGGFAQVCHGTEAPLRRMRAGDWLIYYSPATEMGGGDRLQSFTALGQVVDERVYPHDMGDRVPFRRDLRYERVRPVKLAALSDRLHLTARPNWGMALRRGHLPLDEHDFQLIASAMRRSAET
ncbi:MAG TPA: EVE domain-containing protein [Polyangia bacterium]|nr:EVE domain-containing protein [Polyangia bacterium]